MRFALIAALAALAACADDDAEATAVSTATETAAPEAGADDGGERLDFKVDLSDFEEPPTVVEDDGVFSVFDEDAPLNCAAGFDALREEVFKVAGVELIEETDEQEAYMAGASSFTLTKPEHSAHPAIVRRDLAGQSRETVTIDMSLCGYQSREATERLLAQFHGLNQKFLIGQRLQLEGFEKK